MILNRYPTLEQISNYVNSINYSLLDCYYRKNRTIVELQDVFGYKYLIGFSGLLKGKIPEFVRSNNPYSLENISLWLVKNGNKFKRG